MATIIPIGYNNAAPISGTTQYGLLAVGTEEQDYSNYPGGVRFWGTPDLDLGWVIAKPISGGTQPNKLSIPAFVGFNQTDFIEESFVNLANNITGQNFTTGTQAKVWLENNGFWTSYSSI